MRAESFLFCFLSCRGESWRDIETGHRTAIVFLIVHAVLQTNQGERPSPLLLQNNPLSIRHTHTHTEREWRMRNQKDAVCVGLEKKRKKDRRPFQ